MHDDEYDETRKPTSAELFQRSEEQYAEDLIPLAEVSRITGLPVSVILAKVDAAAHSRGSKIHNRHL